MEKTKEYFETRNASLLEESRRNVDKITDLFKKYALTLNKPIDNLGALMIHGLIIRHEHEKGE